MSNFSLEKTIEILERTPIVLNSLLHGISDEWISANEGGETWTVFDVIGHLAHGEKTDWIPRMEIILSHSTDKTFPTFDRFAQFEESKGKSLNELLTEFAELREESITVLKSKNLKDVQLNLKGIHPAFGEVTLAQLLATWLVHDLDHIAQISRILAKQ
ncbi:MAG: DinB family protein [Acidobacteriota bacterium]